jgi:hypothetical protein
MTFQGHLEAYGRSTGLLGRFNWYSTRQAEGGFGVICRQNAPLNLHNSEMLFGIIGIGLNVARPPELR